MSKKILIDPGHGGKDRANKGYSGKYTEADGNLEFSLKLKEYLSKYDIQVDLTRTTDKTVELSHRGNMAKGYDMFLSIHSNAGGGSGTSVFYSVRQQTNKNNAQKLCETIAKYFGIRARGATYKESTTNKGYDYFTVINYAVRNNCKHVYLLERAFHDNKTEEQYLLDKNKTIGSAASTGEWIAEVLGLGNNNNIIEKTPMYTPGTYKSDKVNSSLNVRLGPGTDYEVIDNIKKGTIVVITKVENKAWGYISALKGWCNISSTYCSKISDSTTAQSTVEKYTSGTYQVTDPTGLNLRNAASIEGRIIKTYPKGTKIYAIKVDNVSWAYDGEGWLNVHSKYAKKISNLNTCESAYVPKIGDKVTVNGSIYSLGNGGTSKKKANATMYITDILSTNKYKYTLSLSKAPKGTREGWGSVDIVKKI